MKRPELKAALTKEEVKEVKQALKAHYKAVLEDFYFLNSRDSWKIEKKTGKTVKTTIGQINKAKDRVDIVEGLLFDLK
ncbi:MAG TPA: hypothetical protein VGO21_05180 [Candidatus Paceibacterota bacterium]|jgi:hypothetical protein|nr:hypothetical protein [Candidatus Paceibacterota bacterium]